MLMMSGVSRVNHKNQGKLKKTLSPILKRWQLYLLLLPAFLNATIFLYKPMYGLLLAFKDYSPRKGIWGSPWVGFENFERLFSSYWFPIILKNTFVISGLTLLITFPAPIILALLVNEIQNRKVKKAFQTISYAPHFISMVVICGMITMFLSPTTGVLSKVITAVTGESVIYLQDPGAFKWVYVISAVWVNTGWGAILYYSVLSSVDQNLHEAAAIDGANRLQRIWHINVPAILPTVSIMFILRCGSILEVGFEKVLLLQNDLNLPGSEIISTYVYKVGLQQGDFSFATAVSLFNTIVNIVFLVTANYVSKRLTKSSLW